MHVFMIGDSVFANRAYIARCEPNVRQQLARILGRRWMVSSAASDGAIIAGIIEQLFTGIFKEEDDFANAIEPSAMGGEKIATAIAKFANGGLGTTSVFI
jgi:hypothetical protein